LLTGATGFIGNAIAKKAAGRLSLISSVRADASSFQPLGHVRVDLGDDRSVAKAVVGCDVVIHAAYDSSQPHREGEFARRLVEAGLREGIRSFVFFGSYSTYNSLCDRVNEASPHSPVRLPYIAGKQDLEDCLIELSESNPDARIILLQPTIVMGEGGSWNRFFNRAANASEVLLPHRGRAPINVIDVNIVAEATVRAALENTLLLSGFHKFLLNGDVNSTWEEMILDRGSINQPRILDAGPGLLAEGLITNTLLCLKYTNRHTWNYPRVKGWEYGTRSSQIKGMVLRGLDRLTVASWAVIDAGAARDAGLID
jgi:nucleoside-diphosphate-sugar epimerase